MARDTQRTGQGKVGASAKRMYASGHPSFMFGSLTAHYLGDNTVGRAQCKEFYPDCLLAQDICTARPDDRPGLAAALKQCDDSQFAAQITLDIHSISLQTLISLQLAKSS